MGERCWLAWMVDGVPAPKRLSSIPADTVPTTSARPFKATLLSIKYKPLPATWAWAARPASTSVCKPSGRIKTPMTLSRHNKSCATGKSGVTAITCNEGWAMAKRVSWRDMALRSWSTTATGTRWTISVEYGSG